MSYTPEEEAKIELLGRLDPGIYLPESNPYGLDGEGYKINWTLGMNAFADVANAVERLAKGAGYALTANTAANITFVVGGYNSVPLNTLSPFVAGHPVQFTFLGNVNVWASGVVAGVEANYIHVRIEHTSADDASVSGTGWSVMLTPPDAPEMTGATAEDDGRPGIVSRPLAGQQRRFWRGDATWAAPDVGDKAPVGTVMAHSGPTPQYYLPCDGSVYLASAYPDLAAVLPTVLPGDEWTPVSVGVGGPGLGFIARASSGRLMAMRQTSGSPPCSVSNDDGVTWTLITAPTIANTVTQLTGGIGDRFGITYNTDKFQLTTDGGTTWTQINMTGITSPSVISVALNADVLLAGGSSGQIYRSTNGGANWAAVTSGVSASISKIKYLGESEFIAINSGATNSIVKSINGGVTWSGVFNSPAGVGGIKDAFVSGGTIFAWHVMSDIYGVSHDRGNTFTSKKTPDGSSVVAIFVVGSRAVMITHASYWISNDSGENWWARPYPVTSILTAISSMVAVGNKLLAGLSAAPVVFETHTDATRFIVPRAVNFGENLFKHSIRAEAAPLPA